MNIASVDPGLTGALAIIDEYRVVFVDDLAGTSDSRREEDASGA
jgi:hypothetical protein